MTPDEQRFKVCTCNGTLRIDARALARALGHEAPLVVANQLCRKDLDAFVHALGADPCVVACTQEAALFEEAASRSKGSHPLRFVNVREAAGWSAEGGHATPKIAALLAQASLPSAEPRASVTYRSSGRVLVIGPAVAAVAWGERLVDDLDVSVLVTDARGAELPETRSYPILSGRVESIAGHLGAFDVAWSQTNPIDLDLCTRCNACVRACPEGAIDFTYQVDMTRCAAHRACVAACGEIGAIDFERRDVARRESFDLVLDLGAEPRLRLPRNPQGYFAPGREPLDQALAARELARLVGEFGKPKYFAYEPRLCAHGRSGKVGCTSCIDVCSTRAIRPAGDGIAVDPHLCMGCGGCSTVCPTGAITHDHPRMPDMGARVKRVLSTYHAAGGRDAALLFHDGEAGRKLVHALGRKGKGLPARVIPIEVHHTAAIGLDLMLGALAYGAAQVLVASSEPDAAAYAEATDRQMRFGATVLDALGYGAGHLRRLASDSFDMLERELWTLAPAKTVARAATFNLSAEKRTTLEFALEHLARHAPTPREAIPLDAGAPWGAIAIDASACTLCKACVGACPSSALVDSPDEPVVRFVERNCVQCGLCAATCPEDAITLLPRLNLAPTAREPVTLARAEPFECVRCRKPFGTRRMIEGMMAKLGGHSMFAGGPALRRLQMCADCRVIDMMASKDEVSVFDVRRDPSGRAGR